MDGELEGDAAGIANTFPDTRGKRHVMAIARHEVVARLGDANDGTTTLQFVARQAIVEETLKVERRHIRILGVIPPRSAAQPTSCLLRFHGTLRSHSSRPSKD